MNKFNVFVYGTLRSNCANNYIFKQWKADFVGSATVSGEMFAGYIPYVRLNDKGTVIGEVYKVDEDCLRRLDCLEGYVPNRDYNHYERVETMATLKNGDVVKTFVYVAGKFVDITGLPKVKDGDFVKLLMKRYEKKELTNYE